MRACTPDRDGYVDCDGVKVFYEVFGEGNEPTIVLVHGWQIAPSSVWKAQVPYLSRHYRVVTYDWPGNGRSDRPESLAAYEADRIAAALPAVMAATCPDPPIVVGHSAGAGVTLQQACAYPDTVRATVLVGGLWTSLNDLDAAKAQAATFAETIRPLGERPDDDAAWEHFIDGFWQRLQPEPHSTKQMEDGRAWARTVARAGAVVSTLSAIGDMDAFNDRLQGWVRNIACPTLVVHDTSDVSGSVESATIAAQLMSADLVVIEGGGHNPHGRDPIAFNQVLREFVDRVHPPAARTRTWTRALTRSKRALFLCSPIGLGHARRDLAIARALREERPELQIDWLAQHPVTALLKGAGERVHAASAALVSESAHWEHECGEHDLHAFQALRRMDEILVANFMVFHDLVEQVPYDLVIADEAWDIDHFLHENPELKRFAYAWLTDFVGFLPMPDGGDTEAALTADYNAEMIEQIARYPRLRDRALFVGDPDDIVPDSFGPGLPSIAAWTADQFSFPGYITGFDLEDRAPLRAELGYRDDETVCIVTVGGTAVGVPLLRKVIAAHPFAAERVPSLRTIVVCGPRIDPAAVDAPKGVEVRSFVPELHRHLQACDVAVVQGGLTTCMELTAARRPFLYFPLANHFEQQRHVTHRLDRHHAGRRMDYRESAPDTIADALVAALDQPIHYLPVGSEGARRAAQALAELI